MSNAVSSMLKAASITNSPVLQHNNSVGSIAAGGLGSVVGIMGDNSKARIGIGPLTFASDCLQAVFKESVRLDVLGLEGSSSLGWTLLPEIKTLIRNFTNDIIEEIGVQVQEDNWLPYREGRQSFKGSLWPPGVLYNPATQSCSRSGGISRRSLYSERASVSVHNRTSSSAHPNSPINGRGSLSPLAAAASEVADEMYLSASYVWVVAVLSEFLAEVWVLLQAGSRGGPSIDASQALSPKKRVSTVPFTNNGDTSKESETKIANEDVSRPVCGSRSNAAHAGQYYSRDDVCEIEPEIASCLLRILVRYVRDVESTVPLYLSEPQDDNFEEEASFTEAQKECFLKTMDAVINKLIPSLDDVIWSNFFSDGSVLVVNPPKKILDRLSVKVREILSNARSSWNLHD